MVITHYPNLRGLSTKESINPTFSPNLLSTIATLYGTQAMCKKFCDLCSECQCEGKDTLAIRKLTFVAHTKRKLSTHTHTIDVLLDKDVLERSENRAERTMIYKKRTLVVTTQKSTTLSLQRPVQLH